jgi:predicted dehydrogenase
VAYRVGIVGSGFGGTVHAPGFSLHPRFELLAIASPNRAAQIARERNIPHAFPSLEAMLDALGDRLDVISVATPPAYHHHAVMRALAARKHVLCEKPFALTLAQAEEMHAAANAAGLANGLVFEFRYGSAIRALHRLVATGEVALLREIEVVRYGNELRRESRRPQSSWWYDGAQGGGLANGFMPHLIDLAFYLGGRREARSAHGFLRTANPERVDPAGATFASTASDGAFALLDLGDGLVARLSVDGTAPFERSAIALVGENAGACASGPNLYDLTVTLGAGEGAREIPGVPPDYPQHANQRPNVVAFLSLLDQFAKQIAGEPHAGPTFADGLAVQRVLAAIGYGT